MNRLLKIVLAIVAALVALVVVAVVLLALFFDANDYRGEIEARVQQATGRSLKIGSIHLSVFPTLGLKLSDTSLGNAKGFGDTPFAKVGEADVGVRLLPMLLHRRLEVGSVYLSNLSLDLEAKNDGQTNWSDLAAGGQATKTPSKAAPRAASGGAPLAALDVGGINIENAAVHYHDAKTGRDLTLDHLNFSADALQPGKPCAFRTSFSTRSTKPAIDAQIQSSGKLTFDLATSHYQIQGYSLGVVASGAGVPGGKQEVKLTGDVDYDGSRHSARLADVTLDAAGITAQLSAEASGIGSDKMAWSAPIKFDTFSPREVLDALGMKDYRSADSSVMKKASFSARASGGADRLRLENVKLVLDQTNASGNVSVRNFKSPVLDAALRIDQFDVDRYLPSPASSRANTRTPKGKPAAGAGDAAPIPVKLLDQATVHAAVDVGKLTAHGAKMSDAALKVDAVRSAAKTLTLSAKLYGGSVVDSTRVIPGSTPTYQQSLKLSGVDLGPLLKDATGKDPVSGKGNVSADLNSAGATVGAVRRALDGTVALVLTDGAVKGFDLGKLLRSVEALQGQGSRASANGTAAGSAQTDFTALSVSGHIAHGILTSNDLKAASPLLRVTGVGTVNLVDDTIDYTAKPMVVNTATGQGGKKLDQLRGVEIPVRITGPLSAPHYQIDLQQMLQQKATQTLHNTLDKEKGKLQDKLKGLFGNGP